MIVEYTELQNNDLLTWIVPANVTSLNKKNGDLYDRLFIYNDINLQQNKLHSFTILCWERRAVNQPPMITRGPFDTVAVRPIRHVPYSYFRRGYMYIYICAYKK